MAQKCRFSQELPSDHGLPEGFVNTHNESEPEPEELAATINTATTAERQTEPPLCPPSVPYKQLDVIDFATLRPLEDLNGNMRECARCTAGLLCNRKACINAAAAAAAALPPPARPPSGSSGGGTATDGGVMASSRGWQPSVSASVTQRSSAGSALGDGDGDDGQAWTPDPTARMAYLLRGIYMARL